MKKRKLTVKVSSIEESLVRFKNVWEKAEQGEKLKTPIEILSFENPMTLMKILSPKRLELLQVLHELGKTSVRRLTTQLDRDYSNVHQDVKALVQAGLVLKDSAGKCQVPWSTIVTEIPLTPTKLGAHRHYKATSVHAHG